MLQKTALAILGIWTTASVVQAQTSQAVCLDQFSFLTNELGQDPCVVAGYVENACTTDGTTWNIPALPQGQAYIGPQPSLVNYCTCSSVAYSLVSACGACQGGSWIAWSQWGQNCSVALTTLGSLPVDVPVGTAIPAWAYQNVGRNDTFNLTIAQLDTAPESTYIGTPTASINYHLSSVNPSITPTRIPTSTATAFSSSSHKSNTGAIAGGVVGGIIGAIILGLLAWFFWRRYHQNKATSPVTFYGNEEGMNQAPTSGAVYEPYPIATPTMFSDTTNSPPPVQKLYDPSDPSTFPQTPASFGYSTTSGPTTVTSHAPLLSPNTYGNRTNTTAGTAGHYTGAAEV